ncbi:MAG: TonB-dependent receptor, partial [Tsuneonella sp.]
MNYAKLVSSAARTALVAGCASLSLPALAQDAAPADAPTASDEIVITAQKREQNVLDVPVAVSVVDQTVLDAAQVSDFSGLTNVSPSLTITTSGNQNQNTVSLRGIGTFSFSTSVEPSVLVMVDEVPLLLPGQAFGNLTDVARIEVLRGPQGTLFGKSASAGVISITTEAPTSTFTGSAEVMATADEEYKVQAGLSGPIGADGGFRLSGYYLDFGGYINNLETGNKLGQLETWGVRGKFDYRIGAVDLTLIADYGDSYGNGGVDTFRRLDQTGPGGTPVNTSYDLTGITPGPDNVDVRINDEQVNDSNQLLLAGKINVDLGFATLSSITSYQNWNYYIENDQDLTPSPSILQLSGYDVKSVTQE